MISSNIQQLYYIFCTCCRSNRRHHQSRRRRYNGCRITNNLANSRSSLSKGARRNYRFPNKTQRTHWRLTLGTQSPVGTPVRTLTGICSISETPKRKNILPHPSAVANTEDRHAQIKKTIKSRLEFFFLPSLSRLTSVEQGVLGSPFVTCGTAAHVYLFIMHVLYHASYENACGAWDGRITSNLKKVAAQYSARPTV